MAIPLFSIIILIFTVSTQSHPLQIHLRNDSDSIRKASDDYGNIVHQTPTGVLYPSSVKEIIDLIKSSNLRSSPFTIAARGCGHSVRGQAMAHGGVVVDMAALGNEGGRIRVLGNESSGFYADVGAEQMWSDVLRAIINHGLSPVSWTDYLYMTVGGTLSNAGISGQSFLYGPQISNVVELDVITGKGKFVTCSKNRNSELYFGVLGGLGQFGIITRARIILDRAPTRVKWVRLLYSNFSRFTRDQEHLISIQSPNYVEGLLITNENETNLWRSSSFSSPARQSDIASLLKKKGILYALELVKYYDDQTASTIDKEFQMVLKELNFIPGFIFSRDASFFDFLNRVGEDNRGPSEYHPWLNLFIPKSGIHDLNAGVLATMIPKLNHMTSSVFLLYPFNRNKWDDRMSAVTPDEDIFYKLGLLHTAGANEHRIIDEFNNEILEFCEKNGIKVKQYMPDYSSEQDWVKHYGHKWESIQRKKAKFDPKRILSPGQKIFNSI